MNSRIHNLLISLTITAVSIILMLILLETGLRVAGWERFFETVEKVEEGSPRQLRIRILHCNTEIRHITREFDVTYRSNSIGYFDREWNQTKKPGTIRIGFFGDSFTMGHGVGSEKAFPRLAGPLISEKTGIATETLNFGIWGSGTLDEREYIEDTPGLGVDHVVICFYINDIFDNKRYLSEVEAQSAKQAEDSKEKVGSDGGGSLIRLKNLLNDNSRIFAFTMERSKNLRDALGLITYPLEKAFTGEERALLEEAAGHLRAIHEFLEKEGIGVTVVYIPSRVQVCQVNVPEEFDLDLPNTILADNLADIDFIDLTEHLRLDDADIYWFREGHFNEEGHELIARLIARRLVIN